MRHSISQPYKPLIAAILPAFNEAENVGAVLRVLLDTDMLDEIILIDDGSVDNTVEVLQQAAATDTRVRIIQHEKNQGKGQAIISGWASTSALYILLLDADLKELTPNHIRVLLEPVLDHRADMTLGLFWGGHLSTDIPHWVSPWSTGQRGLRTEILKFISHDAAAGYGFEVALTVAARQHGYRTRIVPMKGVWHPPSEFHRGFWYGIRWRTKMYGQVFRAIWITTWERYPNARAFFSSIIKT